MSGMRDHKVFQITCSYKRQITESDGGGEVNTVGITEDRHTEVLFVVGPNPETVEGWCKAHFRYYAFEEQEFRIDEIKPLGQLRGFIQEHAW